MEVDFLIENGQVIDGSGSPSCPRRVAVQNGVIVLPEEGTPVTAKEVIDASGLVVSPGFIDIHSHSDLTLLADSRGASKVSQGVTTEIIGNCGFAPVPCPPEWKKTFMDSTSFLYSDLVEWSWTGYRDYLEQFKQRGISINVGFYVGHGIVRASAMGYEDRKPSEDELSKMKQYVAEGMENGALGLSSGMIYPPGVFAETDELVELCKVVAEYGGIYSTHMRNEADFLLDSIEESIQIAKLAGVPLQISHLKASGKRNWGKIKDAIARMLEARKEGVDVHYDFYPYTAGSTFMTALLPNWVHDGGWKEAAKRIEQPETRQAIIRDIEQGIPDWWNPAKLAGWENVLVAFVKTDKNREAEGKTLAEWGQLRGQAPIKALLDLLYEEDGEVGMVIFLMSEEDVQAAAAGELAMVGSDGFAIAKDGVLGRAKPHPRSYGTFPRVFSKYQREDQLFTLEQAVHKMTGLTAAKLNLRDRGLIREGYAADLVLFDPERIKDTATFLDPHQYSEGIQMVLVNGKKAYEDGCFLDPKSGIIVRPHVD